MIRPGVLSLLKNMPRRCASRLAYRLDSERILLRSVQQTKRPHPFVVEDKFRYVMPSCLRRRRARVPSSSPITGQYPPLLRRK